jgi:hypothetical protein
MGDTQGSPRGVSRPPTGLSLNVGTVVCDPMEPVSLEPETSTLISFRGGGDSHLKTQPDFQLACIWEH